MKHRWGRYAGVLAAVFLAACSAVPGVKGPGDIGRSPWGVESAPGMTAWQHLTFPGKSPSQFNYARKDGRDAVAVTASSSVSMLRGKVRIEPSELGSVRFSWKVPQLINGADMALRDADDSPVRIVLVFEGDRSRFSARDALLSELALTLTGEEMPYVAWGTLDRRETPFDAPGAAVA